MQSQTHGPSAGQSSNRVFYATFSQNYSQGYPIGQTKRSARTGAEAHAHPSFLRSQHAKFIALTLLLAAALAVVAILIPRTAHASSAAPDSVSVDLNSSAVSRDSRGGGTRDSAPTALDSDTREPSVVPNLDLSRFVGTWYEISSIPQIFERNCVATQATYTALPNGDVDVYNQCRDKNFEGKMRSIHGKAWAPDPQVPAKLRVQFFWPLSASYWVIALDENSNWAITGSPDRKNLWILSRTRQIDPATYQILLKLAADQGFDTSLLKITPQPAN